MKKYIFIFIFISFFIGHLFGQSNSVSDLIVNRCISMLGRSVPNGFIRIDRTRYYNEEGFILTVENGVVVSSGFQSNFNTFNEAHEFNGVLYNYFENSRNNWILFSSSSEGDIYSRNRVFATIVRPSRRNDGVIVNIILFDRY